MAWDGSGNFTRTNGTQSGAVTWADADAAGNNITTSQHDTHDEDLADGIAACLTKNNESKPTATFAPNANASYDIGTTALKWRDFHFSRNGLIGGTLGVTGITTLGGAIVGAVSQDVFNTVSTTVNAFGAASVALNIGHASAAAAFPGGISIPTGKTLSGAGAINITGTITSTHATPAAVSYENSWVDYGAPFNGVKYYKDASGLVHVEGEMKSGTVGAVAFTLPSGYRPSGSLQFVSMTNTGAGAITVDTSGGVTVNSGGNASVNVVMIFTTV